MVDRTDELLFFYGKSTNIAQQRGSSPGGSPQLAPANSVASIFSTLTEKLTSDNSCYSPFYVECLKLQSRIAQCTDAESVKVQAELIRLIEKTSQHERDMFLRNKRKRLEEKEEREKEVHRSTQSSFSLLGGGKYSESAIKKRIDGELKRDEVTLVEIHADIIKILRETATEKEASVKLHAEEQAKNAIILDEKSFYNATVKDLKPTKVHYDVNEVRLPGRNTTFNSDLSMRNDGGSNQNRINSSGGLTAADLQNDPYLGGGMSSGGMGGGSFGGGSSSNSMNNVENNRFELQGRALLMQYETETDRLVESRTKVAQIASLLKVIDNEVVKQNEMAAQIDEDAEKSIESVQKAEKELIKAKETGGNLQFYMIMWFVGGAIFLLALDWVW